LAALPAGEARALNDALDRDIYDPERLASASIQRLLIAEQHDLTVRSVCNHRAGRCSCPRGGQE
jgi:hypothetical protein